MSLVAQALDLLRRPKTPEELARALDLTPQGTELLLRQLERRGYVRRLSCGAGCGLCGFRQACPGASAGYWVKA